MTVADALYIWAQANPDDVFDLLFRTNAGLIKANARVSEIADERDTYRAEARRLEASCDKLRDRVQQLERLLSQSTTNPHGRSGDPALEGYAVGLRERPGKWAAWPRVLRRSSIRTYVCAIPAGRLRLFAEGQFEAKRVGDLLYVRYIGGAAARYVGVAS